MLSTNGQAACIASETKPNAVPAGLSPPLKHSLIELASKVVKMSSSLHKIWSLVTQPTTDATVVTSTKLGTISIKLVSSLTHVTHTLLVLEILVLATTLVLVLDPGRNIKLMPTALSETLTLLSKKFILTVQYKLVLPSTLIS